MAETIRDVTTHDPRAPELSSSAVEAARMMRDEDVGLIPIVEGDRLIGTVLMAKHELRRLPVVEKDGS